MYCSNKRLLSVLASAALAAAPVRAATLDDSGITIPNSIVYTSGYLTAPNNPYFIAGQSNAAWEACGGAGWVELPYNTASSGNGGGWYSTSTGRFTAPVNGLYLFTASSYVYPAASGMSYIHFDIAVNGSLAGGGRVGSSYQILGLSAGEGTYGTNLRATRLLYMTAGQYASVYNYCSGAGNYRYGDHSYFAGILLQ